MYLFRTSVLFLAAILSLFLTQPAKADWYEAQSDHFVIYADDDERDIVRFVQNLERYHKAMEILTGRTVPPPSPSNRVVIFVVGNEKELRNTAGIASKNVAGLYIPRAGASRAYVQTIRNKVGTYADFSTIVLLHEYAHHFLISSSRFAMPRWMSEGAAEFFSSASFSKTGSITMGRPAEHRAYELAISRKVPVRELLERGRFVDDGRDDDDDDAFYGRSWLLYHYLTFGEERRGQLGDYWRRVRAGEDSLSAGQAVFGDLDVLEKELDQYLDRRKLNALTVDAASLPISEIKLRELPKGEAEMMKVRMASQAGVDEERALELLGEAREIAARYPDDAGVHTALAEAEYDAGFDDRAIAAADAALALDPASANAYVQKGYALFRKAEVASDKDAAFARAMEPMLALNARENDHPIPLIYLYRSFVERGIEPDETARTALEYAAQLAPFDKGLWMEVAYMQALEGKIDLAKASLRPLASDPHGGSRAQYAKMLVATLSDAPEGQPFDLSKTVMVPTSVDLDSGAEDDSGAGEDD